MPTLLLIRHASPRVDPRTPPQAWGLGATAKASVLALAREVRTYAPSRVFTSEERKARETGAVLAEALGLPCEAVPGLHEHERGPADFFNAEEAFRRAMRAFFAQPDTIVFGRETAAQARKRFTDALASLAVGYPDETLAIVAHGTVISLAVALWTGRDAYAFWQRLPLPALVVVTFPEGKIGQVRVRVWPSESAGDGGAISAD